MGYESKVIIADKHTNNNWYEVIGDIDMCVMGYDFLRFFEKELKDDESVIIDNEATNVDKYGDKISYTNDIDTLIKYLENVNNIEHYRRIDLLLGTLKSINKSNWDNIIIMHYGH